MPNFRAGEIRGDMSAATTTDNTTQRETKTEETKRSGRCTGASAASGKNKASRDSEVRNCPMNDGISVILNGGICIPTIENVFSDSERRNWYTRTQNTNNSECPMNDRIPVIVVSRGICMPTTQKVLTNDRISVILNGGIVYHELRMSYE